jgi:L-lactate dehydrogenase complex protein LldG
MPDSAGARATILASIRHALGEAQSPAKIATEYAALPRAYTRSSATSKQDLVELFADRLHEYDAGVHYASAEDIPHTIAAILSRRGRRRIAIPAGLPASWLPPGFMFEVAHSFSKHELDRVDGLLSGCTAAIAETGTVVLQNNPAQGSRILSLVPDYHLCIVLTDQLVATVPEAFARLEKTSNLPTTFISGPSATADIEMTRIRGVHGPRFLDVLVVTG